MSQDHTIEGWCLLVAGEPLALSDGPVQFVPVFAQRAGATTFAQRHGIAAEVARAGAAVKHKPCRKRCEGRATDG